MSHLVIDNDTTDLYYDQTVGLEGLEYLMRFTWMNRTSQWLLDIYDQDENPLASGIALVVGWSLLRRFKDSRLPPGVLMCVDVTGQNNEISVPGDLGDRVLLMYITSDDPTLA